MGPNLIVVGGVPGAGKSTAMARIAGPGVRILDPDRLRARLRAALPTGTPYRLYRPVVHSAHAVRTLIAVLAGPVADEVLVIHEPATRPRRRAMFARLARLWGWCPALVFVDVSAAAARRGQRVRGRVVDADCFRGHCARWQRLRPALAAGDTVDGAVWDQVRLTDRESATTALADLIEATQRQGVVTGSCSVIAAATSTSPLTSGAYRVGTATSTKTARPMVV